MIAAVSHLFISNNNANEFANYYHSMNDIRIIKELVGARSPNYFNNRISHGEWVGETRVAEASGRGLPGERGRGRLRYLKNIELRSLFCALLIKSDLFSRS